MGQEHLLRERRIDSKETEDEILMKESRMVSKSPSQPTKKPQRTNQKHQYVQWRGDNPAGEVKINWER